MLRIPFLAAAALVVAALPARAQDPVAAGRCSAPDSVVFRGDTRTAPATLRTETTLPPAGTPLNARDVQRAVKALYATGRYDDVGSACELGGDRASLVFTVQERPLLADYAVVGTDRVSGSTVRSRVGLVAGRPVDPAVVARSVAAIDSVYEARGYYLARIEADTTVTPDGLRITFRIDEGRRLAVSGVRIEGNDRVGDKSVVDAMKTRPEGFLWWRKGAFDENELAGDVSERIPLLYARRGFIDARVTDDTLLIDRELGKALVEVRVEEGVQYRIGTFEPPDAKVFSSEDIARFYPFGQRDRSLREMVLGVFRRDQTPGDVFDQQAWEEATQKVTEAYQNEGYIRSRVYPIVERSVGPDSVPVVNLRWDIEEGAPSIIRRVEIVGNDVTVESCIRDQLLVVPGDVFNRERLIRSYQSISNLGFFESPLPPPDTREANDKGDVDIIFNVKEKRTGTVNFGASVGQGTGLGGFIGFEQPNLFGRCKRGTLQWQFGQFINDFNLSYTDPTILQTRISGTVNAYHTQSRYTIKGLGRTVRTGGQLQARLPVPWSRWTRATIGYGGEAIRYGQDGAFSGIDCTNCFRSTVTAGLNHDTRFDLPFPTAGSSMDFTAQFNGGPLGGTAAFQKYTGEMRSYATLAQVGGTNPGSSPIKFVVGLNAKAGALFGDAGPFYLQRFSLGGVQFGEQLRGYEEFSITPRGYVGGDDFQAQIESFGNAFFTTSAEFGVRFNQQIYLHSFFDAGNVWNRAREFDPTRLYRGAGVGASLVTPLGPLGLDLGYGFDRLDEFGRRAGKWQVHFKLGQFF
ncbi:MAG: outer membrane protein assembly factor BamA [Gemmatimonadaceae bacterium]|nr:outer membrane protein assembly factor BamA [Gemmatimonadaceae bacterium]